MQCVDASKLFFREGPFARSVIIPRRLHTDRVSHIKLPTLAVTVGTFCIHTKIIFIHAINKVEYFLQAQMIRGDGYASRFFGLDNVLARGDLTEAKQNLKRFQRIRVEQSGLASR